ncbi:hypothetical protein SISSUDRAFT_984079, partial [Sistotremastrum suecicum HHB10207 ss-3]
DSAYTVSERVIPIHKKPAALEPANAAFDKMVSTIRVRSEHCMGALKGRFQSLRGLRVLINRKRDHVFATRWIEMCMILHNLVVDVEGDEWAQWFIEQVPAGEVVNRNEENAAADVRPGADAKRATLVADYAAYRAVFNEI